MIWRRVTLDYPPNRRIIESRSKNVRIAPNFFWNYVKWRKRNKNTSNQCVLVCFTAFFPHKTSNFNELEQKWPGLTYFDTVLHPHLLKFFFAVFARTRGIYLRMIMPSDFLLRRAVFFWRKKNLGGGGRNDPPLGLLGLRGASPPPHPPDCMWPRRLLWFYVTNFEFAHKII